MMVECVYRETNSEMQYCVKLIELFAIICQGRIYEAEVKCQSFFDINTIVEQISDMTNWAPIRGAFLSLFLEGFLETERKVKQIESSSQLWRILQSADETLRIFTERVKVYGPRGANTHAEVAEDVYDVSSSEEEFSSDESMSDNESESESESESNSESEPESESESESEANSGESEASQSESEIDDPKSASSESNSDSNSESGSEDSDKKSKKHDTKAEAKENVKREKKQEKRQKLTEKEQEKCNAKEKKKAEKELLRQQKHEEKRCKREEKEKEKQTKINALLER